MQDKGRRQQKILSLIRAKQIGTQTDLVAALEKAGFEVTQSSISRDLDELGIVKSRGYYAVPRSPEEGMARRGLVSVKPAGDSLIVIHCEAGFASPVSVAIDKASLPEIVGTIAGDDTIFVAVNGKKAQAAVMQAVLDMFETTESIL